MWGLANPGRFMRLAAKLSPWTQGLAGLLLAVGTFMALFVAPADYQQGETVRIMFVHVPAAWMALMIYSAMAVASAVGLIWKHPLADVSARSMAPVGAAFTAIALATGSLWGKPMWGTWWVWDARLTSFLVLFFLYLGYMALWDAFDEPARGARAAAILALVGAVNVPIIKFSVDWWNTLHQPASLIRAGGPAIDPALLWPLLVMAIAFMAYALAVILIRMRAELIARRLRALQIAEVHRRRPMAPSRSAR